MKPTYQIAMAAGLDAGNRRMQERGASTWDEADYAHAAQVASELMEVDPTPWCSGCGAKRKADCDCGPIADNE